MKHRTFTLILAALLAALPLTSCGGDAPAGDSTPADTTSAAPETTRDTLDPTLDFGGETVTLIVDKELPITDYTSEQTGDIVDDALYERTLAVQERLNVQLDFFLSEGAYDNRMIFQGHIKNSVLAGDASYDIAAGYSISIATLGAEEMLCNISELPHIDFSKPWWSSSLEENIALNGNLYFVTGDISTNSIGTAFSVFFNKPLAEEYKIEDLYKLVDDGKWTLDKLLSISGEIYSDLNGDGKRGPEDRYGMTANQTSFDNLYYCTGMTCVNPDKEYGMVVSPDFGSEKMVNLLEKLCTAFNHTDGNTYAAEGEAIKPFMQKNALFFLGGMSAAANYFREADFAYGVHPTPKWDEAQKEYRSTHAYTSAFYGIPLDAKDPDMSAAVIEAMAIEGYYNVAPAYFETALKVKYSSDDDSARMFDIIRAGVTYDFGRVYSTAGLDGIPGKLRGMVTSDNINWMSTYESSITQFETLLAELVEKLGG